MQLLFKALFWRVFQTDYRRILLAVIAMSLAVGLATAMRIATGLAEKSLTQSLESIEGDGWVGPLYLHNSSASLSLQPLFAKFAYKRQAREGLMRVTSDGRFSPFHVIILGPEALPIDMSHYGSTAPAVHVSKKCNMSGLLKLARGGTELSIELQSEDALSEVPCHIGFVSIYEWEKLTKSQIQLSEIYFRPTEELKYQLQEKLTFLSQTVQGLEYLPVQTSTKDLAGMTNGFRNNLQIMGSLATFVGGFLVFQVFSIILLQHQKSIAILRTLGFPWRKVFIPLMSLAAALSLSAGVLGFIIGIIAGRFLGSITLQTSQGLFNSLIDVSAYSVDITHLAFSLGTSAIAVFISCAVPLIRLYRTTTLQALHGYVRHSVPMLKQLFFYFGMLLGLVGFIFFVIQKPHYIYGTEWGGYAAAFATFLLAILLGSFATRVLFLLARPFVLKIRSLLLFRIFFASDIIINIQILVVALTLTAGVRSMTLSFRSTLQKWSETLVADIWVRVSGTYADELPREIVDTLQQFKKKSSSTVVDSLKNQSVVAFKNQASDRFQVVVSGAYLKEQIKVRKLPLVKEQKNQDKAVEVISKNTLCAGTQTDPCYGFFSLPLINNLRINEAADLLRIESQGKVLYFRSAAVYRDYSSDQGVLLTDMAVFDRVFDKANKRPSFMNITFPDDSLKQNAGEILKDLQNRFSEEKGYAVQIWSVQDLKSRILTTFDKTFQITDVLYVIVLLIAILTTLLSIWLRIATRFKEWTTLWALGINKKKIKIEFAKWSCISGVFSGILAVFPAWILSFVLVRVVQKNSFGWELDFEFSFYFTFFMAILMGFLSLIYGWLAGYVLNKQFKIQTLFSEF